MDQNEFIIKFKKLEIVNSAIHATIKYGSLVAIAAIFSSALKALSGKQTILNIAMTIVAHLNLSEKVSYTLGLGGVLYGYRQRRLRRLVIEKMSEHQKNLERIIDPKRSSSEITRRGTTRPDDKLLG